MFGRVLHWFPTRRRLLVNHQPDLVAEVQLLRAGQAADEPHGVVPGRLGHYKVSPHQVRVLRHDRGDGEMIPRVRGPQEDSLAVEPEVSLFHSQFAEAAADRPLVLAAQGRDASLLCGWRPSLAATSGRGGQGWPPRNAAQGRDAQAHLHAIEERIVQVPEPMLWNGQLEFVHAVAWRDLHIAPAGILNFAAVGGPGQGLQAAPNRCGRCVAERHPRECGRSWRPAREHVGDPHGRQDLQPNRAENAAVILNPARLAFHRLAAMRSIFHRHAVHRLAAGHQHSHGQQIVGVGFHRIGGVQFEGRLAPFVSAHGALFTHASAR